MFPCCAYDPGFLLFALGDGDYEPEPDHDILAISLAVFAAAGVMALLMLVS
ncbi:hypothetical protein [Celeribacter indicus]|uniref:hypothetical protein n=1 Tax=Celeribacter indicus TaxID=1208324 RepID=UPI000894325C|nr:hypothetical protein [Celeribacter indicus]SDW62077.1 hypothetical protein SAMN05443573_10574 [Celeribacter indicus]